MITSIQAKQLNQTALSAFRILFSSLAAPPITAVTGVFQAEFVGPAWLRAIAGPGLAPLGLGSWWGKRFDNLGNGVNIVRTKQGFRTKMPVTLVELPSLIDGKQSLTVVYPDTSRLPWPWVVDELRLLEPGCLLGMTLVKPSPFNKLALPFLLHQSELPDER